MAWTQPTIFPETNKLNASEVVRAGLRLLEEEEKRINTLRGAILEGTESGIAFDFT